MLGVTVHAGFGKDCRLYQYWVGLEKKRCLSYEPFRCIEDDTDCAKTLRQKQRITV